MGKFTCRTVWITLTIVSAILLDAVRADDTFSPYQPGEVPQSVADLWADYDARREPLEVKVVKEWETEDVITRYVTFTVGTFKGIEARIAAYYTFPRNTQACPAFVWSHGGGQRADRRRGLYFARQGYATLDINWLGRPLEDGITVNTDWGKVDPTQGPRFYAKALRKGWKLNLQPDEHTIDPIASPRNSNWFLLAVAARRAITFLEQQPEVDPERIGLAGFSMGGMITALTAPDPRLKAVAPFVGGTGFKDVDFPGVEGSSIRPHFKDLELYKNTMDAKGYWPLVKCPVVFISSTNDFHSAFDRIYQSMDLLPHDDWRVSTNVHENHGPGPEQWVMLNVWFDRYLKGIDRDIPRTPPSTLGVDGERAVFRVTPEDVDRLVDTEIYYSYDPNARTRFWHRAEARRTGGAWSVELPVEPDLPLYVFALCRYQLQESRALQHGETETLTLNSREHSVMPKSIRPASLAKLQQQGVVFEDFSHGTRDWSSRNGRSIKTYKFQSPTLDRSNGKRLVLTIDPEGRRLELRLRVSSQFLSRPDNLGDFSFDTSIEGQGPQDVFVDRKDFKSKEGKMLEWSKIATLTVTLVDKSNGQPLNLVNGEGRSVLHRIDMVE